MTVIVHAPSKHLHASSSEPQRDKHTVSGSVRVRGVSYGSLKPAAAQQHEAVQMLDLDSAIALLSISARMPANATYT